MYKVFLDTNIILDYFLDNRGPYEVNAELIFDQCVRGEIECYIAPHTISNVFFILRKYCSPESSKLMLSSLCKLCKVQTMDHAMIEQAINDTRFSDLEDAMQMVCAEKCGADVFVTRDEKGFHKSRIKVSSHYLSEDAANIMK